MKHLLPIFALCTATAPAAAQDDPIYAPCLEQFPAPDDFGDAGDYISAMETAGWTHLTTRSAREEAFPALAELSGLVLLPARFRDAEEAQAYADQALQRYTRVSSHREYFSRGDLLAALTAAIVDPGVTSVACTFAGPIVPGIDGVLPEGHENPEDLAALMAMDWPDLSDERVEYLLVAAYRLDGSEDVLAPLTARQGFEITYDYETPE